MRFLWRSRSRWRDQRGSTLIEFSLVLVPLLLLVFGIIFFGLLLSFQQGLTQAAAEGARAAAVAPLADAPAVAEAATVSSIAAFNKECGNPWLTCTYTVGNCAVAATPATTTTTTVGATNQCINVRLDYRRELDPEPVVPPLPFVGSFLSELHAESEAQLNLS